MTQKCNKCKNSLNKPYYILIRAMVEKTELYCVGCWNQERKSYQTNNPASSVCNIVYKVGKDGKKKQYDWNEENKRWQTEDGEVDEDCQSDNSRERERANSNSDCWIRSNY